LYTELLNQYDGLNNLTPFDNFQLFFAKFFDNNRNREAIKLRIAQVQNIHNSNDFYIYKTHVENIRDRKIREYPQSSEEQVKRQKIIKRVNKVYFNIKKELTTLIRKRKDYAAETVINNTRESLNNVQDVEELSSSHLSEPLSQNSSNSSHHNSDINSDESSTTPILARKRTKAYLYIAHDFNGKYIKIGVSSDTVNHHQTRYMTVLGLVFYHLYYIDTVKANYYIIQGDHVLFIYEYVKAPEYMTTYESVLKFRLKRLKYYPLLELNRDNLEPQLKNWLDSYDGSFEILNQVDRIKTSIIDELKFDENQLSQDTIDTTGSNYCRIVDTRFDKRKYNSGMNRHEFYKLYEV
jgi:hypothetical protein